MSSRAISSVLIVEDDPHYARVLLGLARDKGFKGLVATRGHEALSLARQYRPTAITLDIFLPDMLGWTVLNNLKLAPETRHIPVQIISMEEERSHGLSHGAFSYLVKPATTEDLESAFDRIKTFVAPRTKRLLVVEDNDIERQSIVELLGHDDIEITTVATGEEAYRSSARSALRLLRARSSAAGHDRLRTARQAFRPKPVCAMSRSSSLPARICPTRRKRGCARWPRASCSRTCNRPSGCSMRPRSFCTAC